MAVVDMPLSELKVYHGKNPCPADFDAFWEKGLNEMNAVDPAIELRRAKYTCSFADCFDMYFTGVKNARVYAKLVKPKAAKSAESKTKSSKSSSPSKTVAKDNQITTDNVDNGDGNKPGNGRSKTQTAGKQPAMSEAQKRAIYNLSRRRGISVEDLEQMSVDAYGVAVENLTSKDASAFIRNLQQAA